VAYEDRLGSSIVLDGIRHSVYDTSGEFRSEIPELIRKGSVFIMDA